MGCTRKMNKGRETEQKPTDKIPPDVNPTKARVTRVSDGQGSKQKQTQKTGTQPYFNGKEDMLSQVTDLLERENGPMVC